MHRFLKTAFAILLLLFIIPLPCTGYDGNGVKIYPQTETGVVVEDIPSIYNGSFIVRNDGYRDGVYVIRVAVDSPLAISWLELSQSAFVLAPGESKLVYFSINLTPENVYPGRYSYIFTPALLPENVEPYMDQFASYVSYVDRYTFDLTVPGPEIMEEQESLPPGIPVVFGDTLDRANFIQYSVPLDDNRTVTLIDRAIRLNAPQQAVAGESVEITTSVFEGLSDAGISIMAVSPEGNFYPVRNGNFSFTETGKWGLIVLVGEEMILGKSIDVVEPVNLFSIPDVPVLLASMALLLLLSIVPIWFVAVRGPAHVTGAGVSADPYSEIAYKAYVVKKNINAFDRSRLSRVVGFLEEEYDELVSRGTPGRRQEASSALQELRTLANLEQV